MLRIGMFLGGRYEVLSHIGSGGMSDVYKARDHKLNRLVAIKVLKEEFNSDDSFLTKFKAEAQASACLTHPNIVNVYDVGNEAGIHYIVMELVEGITLKNYISRKGHLEVRETIGISIQVAQGLEAAHEQKIVHRDIKPQNIIISREGKVKVADFGIARATTEHTMTTVAMGSVHYLSPEQARGGFCDERSDIYSLGVTMFEMLTGVVPFGGDTAVSVAMSHIQSEIPSPAALNGAVPVSLEKIVMKCLQKKPEQRYQSASALISDLKRALLKPDEDFVKIVPLVHSDAPTMVMNEDEMAMIKEGSRRAAVIEDDKGAEEKYLLGLEDPSDEEVPEEPEEPEDTEDEKEEKTDRILAIVMIAIAVLVVLGVIYIFGSMFGLFGNKTPETTDAVSTELTTEESKEVALEDLTGKTLSEAEQILRTSLLGRDVVYDYSDDYEEGTVIRYGLGEYGSSDFKELKAGDMVEKHTTVTLVLSAGKSMITVPLALIGKAETDAHSMLTSAGFTNIHVERGESDTIEAGLVYNVSPASGRSAPADGEIILYVSTGTSKVKVPDLSSYNEDDMDQVLANLELVPSASSQYSDTVEEGRLISQTPSAGTLVAKGSTVRYVISNGPKPTEPPTEEPTEAVIQVPNLIGKNESGARQVLEAKGLVLGHVEEVYSDETPGTVIWQSIPEGDEVKSGASVDVHIAKEKKEQSIAASIGSSDLTVGDTTSVSVSGAHGSVTYSSSNTSVVTVDSSGNVKAVGAGSATITVHAAGTDEYKASNEASVSVNVTASVEPEAPPEGNDTPSEGGE